MGLKLVAVVRDDGLVEVLNRTSVGLKPRDEILRRVADEASIEPAWD